MEIRETVKLKVQSIGVTWGHFQVIVNYINQLFI